MAPWVGFKSYTAIAQGLSDHQSPKSTVGGVTMWSHDFLTSESWSSTPYNQRGCNLAVKWPLNSWGHWVPECSPAWFLAANIGKPTLVSKMYRRINYSTAILVEFPSTNLLLQVSAHPWLCPLAIRWIKKKPDLSSIPKAQIISCPAVYSRKHLMVCLSWKCVRQMHNYCTIK